MTYRLILTLYIAVSNLMKTYLEISILLYADDIVLISDTEESLQCQLSKLMNLSAKWNLYVNCDNTKIMYARKLKGQITRLSFAINLLTTHRDTGT